MVFPRLVAAPLLGGAVLACAHAQGLGEVVVTATRDERPAQEVLADVTTIDAQAIRRAGASSVPELLRALGGVEISQNGGAGATSGIFVRGTKTSQSVILVDGVRLDNATSGTANLEFLSLSSIERIEVVRGPLSSLYGSGAIGGVIQIFTRQGSGPPAPSFSLGFGSQGSAHAQAGVSGSAGAGGSTRYALTVAGERTDGHDATLPSSTQHQPDRDGNSRRSATASLRQALPAGWEAGASVLATSGRVHYDDAFSTPESARMHYRTSALSAFARGEPARGWHTEVRAGRTRIEYGFAAFDFAPRADTLTLAWQNRIALPAGRLLLGVEQLRQRLAGEGVVTGPYAYLRDERRTDSAFAGYELALGAHWLRLQVRSDHIENVGSEPSGTLAWGYQWTRNWLLRASAASAFRAPTFDDLYNPFGSNPALRPERSHGGEIAAEYREGTTFARITAFRSRIRDAIELDASFTPRNIDSARVTGVSFDARHRVGAWTLRGTATLQDPRGERFDPAGGEPVSGQLARRARRFASLGADWQAGGVRVGGDWLLQSRRVDSDNNPIAGYGVIDLSAAWSLAAHWEAFVRLGNVGDKRYETAAGYAMASRNLFVGVRYRAR